MFTNGHHHSSTHVALAIAQHTRKIREAQREQRKWNISAGDCRSMPKLQTMLSTQSFLCYCRLCTLRLTKHTFCFLLYTIKQCFQAGNYPFLRGKKCFEMGNGSKGCRCCTKLLLYREEEIL